MALKMGLGKKKQPLVKKEVKAVVFDSANH
jgi:hypothetical protein